MMRPCSQRGEGRLGFIITLVVFVAGLYTGFKVVPVRIDAYQFRDKLRDEARFASVHHNADTEIKQRILEEAASMDIPLDPGAVSITRSRREVVIRAHYEQPIDLKLTTYTYRFSGEERSPIF